MNRLWAAAGLLAVLITICTLAVISTQSITTSITQDIALIADTSLQDDKDTALTLSRQAGEKCNRIIEMVQHLNEAELPYIQNIL